MSGLSKTNIKEANEQLKQMHQRIYDLETQLQLHSLHIEELQKNNQALKRSLAQEVSEKENMEKAVKDKEELVERLLGSAEEKDKLIAKLEDKSRLFHELVEHKAALEHIIHVLDDVSKSCDQSRDLHSSSETGSSSTSSNHET